MVAKAGRLKPTLSVDAHERETGLPEMALGFPDHVFYTCGGPLSVLTKAG